MRNLENRLSIIGYRVDGRTAECWRVERIGSASRDRADRTGSALRDRALTLWLDRLRDRPQSAAYRICLASDAD